MPHIRRLRLDSDSDEEEEEQQQHPHQPQPEPHTHFPAVEISDDEDLIDSLSPPRPACPVTESLLRLGLSLKREWVAACLGQLQASVPAFEQLDVAAKAKRCFEQFLYADMNLCGGGVLPPNVHSMHLRILPGPYILQVDEIINISCRLRDRYSKANPGIRRCFKLSMTDGIQRVFGMEYRPINALQVSSSSGLKVVISNVQVRRGLLMLVPETIEILGGLVEELDAARERLVKELEKPPRGIRTRNGELLPLATRATLAAWPSSGVDDLPRGGSTQHRTDTVQENNQGAGPSMFGTGNSFTTEHTLPMGAPNVASNSIPHMASNAEAMNMDMPRPRDTNPNPVSCASPVDAEMHIDAANVTGEYSVDNRSANMFSNVSAADNGSVNITREGSAATECPPIAENVETYGDRTPVATHSSHPRRTSPTVFNTREHSVDTRSYNMVSNVSSAHDNTVHITRESSAATECPPVEYVETYRDRTPVATDSSHPQRTSSTVFNTREYSVDNLSSNMVSNVSAAHNDIVHITRESYVVTECPPIVENVETYRDRAPVATDSSHPRITSSTVLNTRDVEMVDASDHQLILSGDQEVPFTYIASLSAKWAKLNEEAPLVRGKIKCFLTAVKGFKYKKRTTYHLQAYVDDGSLISEILIDHNVVQKGIGFTPEEVTAALSSPDTKIVQQMKDTMRKFQAFLANFEGIIVVELNKKSTLPLALEMSQGCPQSDARLLLRRLKSLYPPEVQKPTDPIELSP